VADDLQVFGGFDDGGPAVRPLGRVLALAGLGAVQLRDPGGVVDRAVDLDGLVVEMGRQRLQHGLDEAAVVGRQVDPI
jgi:hypothetical protein